MDHFETYADAGNACLAVEEAMERKQAEIDVLADALNEVGLSSLDNWAEALADFAYWPTAPDRSPERSLVYALKALVAGDDVQFARYCRDAILYRIKETAREAAELRLNP